MVEVQEDYEGKAELTEFFNELDTQERIIEIQKEQEMQRNREYVQRIEGSHSQPSRPSQTEGLSQGAGPRIKALKVVKVEIEEDVYI